MPKVKNNYSQIILEAINSLPYFRIEDLMPVCKDRGYLKQFLYRGKQSGKIVSLKRGVYVSVEYLELLNQKGGRNDYYEFVANNIYQPSYLSGEYVMQKYGLLSESVNSFVSISSNKTKKFLNDFGIFKYHHLKDELFCGFKNETKNGFIIAEATLAKSVFDFLYLRKYILNSLEQVKALRLNLENIKKKDLDELKKYINKEKSKKMKLIYNYLVDLYE